MTNEVTTVDSIYDIFKTPEVNQDAFENGKWFDITPTSRIKLRHATSPESLRIRKELDEPYAKRVDAGAQLTANESKEIFLQNVAQAIVVDWEGPIFVNAKGKKVKYSAAAAYDLLGNPKLEKFLEFVMTMSMAQDEYLTELDNTSEKN